MSQTRLLCEKCGFPQCYCTCPRPESQSAGTAPESGATPLVGTGGMVGLPALSSNQADILSHTSRTGRYVSDEEPDLTALVQRGLLHDHGAQSLAGGMHYYTSTPEGRAALNAHRQSARTIQRQPEPNTEMCNEPKSGDTTS